MAFNMSGAAITDEELMQTTTGAFSGAATGAAIGAAGGPIGMGAGALIGAGISFLGERSQSAAREKVLKDAVKVRRRATLTEMGARQQAENIAMGGLVRQPQQSQSSNTGMSGQGFIGQNLPTNAGTF